MRNNRSNGGWGGGVEKFLVHDFFLKARLSAGIFFLGHMTYFF